MLEIYTSKEDKALASKTYYRAVKTDEITEGCWINLYSPTEGEINRVVEELDIPIEFLRYPLDEEERPRIDFDDDDKGVTLVIVDIPYSHKENDVIKYETTPLGIILADKHIVTVSLKETRILENFVDNRVKDLYIPFRTRFTIQILYSVAREYLRLLRFIDKTLELTESGLAKIISNSDLYKLMELRKSLVYFASSLKSNEAVLDKLMRGRVIKLYDDDEDLLEDVVIEYRQAHEMADIYANIVSCTMDAYAAIINNNVNSVMKVLAAFTICLTIPDLIGSFFGQNCDFPWDPGFATNPYPFIFLLSFAIISTVITIIVMKKKQML